jgi:hypothetical protein
LACSHLFNATTRVIERPMAKKMALNMMTHKGKGGLGTFLPFVRFETRTSREEAGLQLLYRLEVGELGAFHLQEAR